MYRVVTEGRMEFRVKCHNCRFARSYGASQLEAERAAVRHRQPSSRTHHVVDVILGATIVHTFGLDKRQGSLLDSSYDEDTEDEPPF